MTQIISENLRSSLPPSALRSQRVCRHFARGRCTWGASCRFSHDVKRPSLDDVQINPAFIGAQQQQLQKERHAILKAALDGDFEIKPYNVSEGFQRHIVHLRMSPSIPLPRLLTEDALKQQLVELEGNEQLRMGGLLFLVGEPVVFWSMMQLYCIRRTTTSSKWDTLLANAKRGCVECMFFRSAVGCLGNDCPFLHTSSLAASLAAPLQNMATNNALLTPLLGFGAATTTTTAAAALTSVGGAVTKSHITCGPRPPADPVKHVSAAAFSANKTEDSVALRDPVWGTCGLSETKSSTEPQGSFSFLWGGSGHGVTDAEW